MAPSPLPQAGGWVVLLEGRCRLRVCGVHLSSRPPLELYEATIEQLDYLPGRGAAAASKRHEELAQELLAVSRRRRTRAAVGWRTCAGVQRRCPPQGTLPNPGCRPSAALPACPQATRRLFVLIQGEGEGREAAARVARALAQQGPARMADVVGSLAARSLPDRLSLLSTLSVTARLQVGGGSSRGCVLH